MHPTPRETEAVKTASVWKANAERETERLRTVKQDPNWGKLDKKDAELALYVALFTLLIASMHLAQMLGASPLAYAGIALVGTVLYALIYRYMKR